MNREEVQLWLSSLTDSTGLLNKLPDAVADEEAVTKKCVLVLGLRLPYSNTKGICTKISLEFFTDAHIPFDGG